MTSTFLFLLIISMNICINKTSYANNISNNKQEYDYNYHFNNFIEREASNTINYNTYTKTNIYGNYFNNIKPTALVQPYLLNPVYSVFLINLPAFKYILPIGAISAAGIFLINSHKNFDPAYNKLHKKLNHKPADNDNNKKQTTNQEPDNNSVFYTDFDENTQSSQELKKNPSNKLKISPIILQNIQLINELNNSQITKILKQIKKSDSIKKYLFDPKVFRSEDLLKINKKFIINFLLDPKYMKNSLFIEVFVGLVLRIQIISLTDLAYINGIDTLDIVKIKDAMKNDFYKKAVDHIKNAKLLTKKVQKSNKQQTMDQSSSVNRLTTKTDTLLVQTGGLTS